MRSLMQNQVVKNASPPMKHSIPFKKFYNAKLDIIPIVLKYPANVKKKQESCIIISQEKHLEARRA